MANRKKDKKLIRITVSVDPDDHASFDRLAQSSGYSTSWLLRQAMREFLERHEGKRLIQIPLDKPAS